MKKIYIQPEMISVKLQHMQMLCQSDSVGGDTFTGGGNDNGGDGSGDDGDGTPVKGSRNVWDDEW